MDVSVAVVVAVAGAGWPVEAAKVAPEETAEDDLDFFFFLAVCGLRGRLHVSKTCLEGARLAMQRNRYIPHATPRRA